MFEVDKRPKCTPVQNYHLSKIDQNCYVPTEFERIVTEIQIQVDILCGGTGYWKNVKFIKSGSFWKELAAVGLHNSKFNTLC